MEVGGWNQKEEVERCPGEMLLFLVLAGHHPSFPALDGFTNESSALRLLHSMACFITRTQTSNFEMVSFSCRFLHNWRPVL